jgi:DNA cross-link repair 1A protein
VVVFKPTGWAMQRGKAHANVRGRRQQRGTVVSYQVPYSEHSNLRELRQFVSWLQPSAIKLHSFSGRSEADCLALLRQPQE